MKCPGCGKTVGRFQVVEDPNLNAQVIKCPRTGAKYLIDAAVVIPKTTTNRKSWKKKKGQRKELELVNG